MASNMVDKHDELRKEWIEEAYQHGKAGNFPNPDEGDIAFNVIDLNRWGSISMGELAELQEDITAAFERGVADSMPALDAALIPVIMKECGDHDLDFGKVIQDVVKPDIPIMVKVALYGDETGWPADQIESARSYYR